MKPTTFYQASFIMVLTLGMACNSEPNLQDADKEFNRIKEEFVAELWKLYPTWASSQGYHAYDSLLVINNEDFRKKESEFASAWQQKIWQFKPTELESGNRTDWQMMDNFLKGIAFYSNELKSHEWDPSNYNVGSVFGEMISGTYAPLDERLRAILQRLALVPAYFENAKKQLTNPTLEHTRLAISQNTGSLGVFQHDILDSVAVSGLSEAEKLLLKQHTANAIRAIQDYVAFLNENILPGLSDTSARSFRLGKELFEKKFAFEIQSRYTAEEMYAKALAHKNELHNRMYDLTLELWPKYLKGTPVPTDSLAAIRLLIDKLSVNHSKPENFQKDIEAQIPKLAAFVKEKDLIYLDPAKPLKVRLEPAYMAGVAGASISAPGPYDKNGKTYYNVGSLSNYTAEQAESYLREYNDYILQILNIHEAIPGHYAQLVYSNNSPSLVKSILGNGAMVEGWAVYAERMMLENGYGNNSPEMWLMYYKWNLRATCNTLLDIGVHCNNLSKEDALDLLIRQAFQQKAEAEGKWNRATLTQVQLCSYFTGFHEIYEFRQVMKQRLGDKFNIRQFHEKFLSYGSAPVKYIRAIMEEEERIH